MKSLIVDQTHPVQVKSVLQKTSVRKNFDGTHPPRLKTTLSYLVQYQYFHRKLSLEHLTSIKARTDDSYLGVKPYLVLFWRLT